MEERTQSDIIHIPNTERKNILQQYLNCNIEESSTKHKYKII